MHYTDYTDWCVELITSILALKVNISCNKTCLSIFSEPNHFQQLAPNIPVSPTQAAADFITLRAIMSAQSLKGTILAGPDTGITEYMAV